MGKQLKNFRCKGKTPTDGLPPIPDELKAGIDKYKDMGEDALVNQLMSKVQTSKQNGTYNSKDLDNFVKMVSPHLNRQQKERLQRLVGVIENE